MEKRLLPHTCYDFFVEDGRDGERWGPFDTMEAAGREAIVRRRGLDKWQRSVIQIVRELSEPKIKRLIMPRQRNVVP